MTVDLKQKKWLFLLVSKQPGLPDLNRHHLGSNYIRNNIVPQAIACVGKDHTGHGDEVQAGHQGGGQDGGAGEECEDTHNDKGQAHQSSSHQEQGFSEKLK